MNTKCLSAIMLIVLAGGCTRSIHFRVVDASTGQPLAGVHAGMTSSHGDFILAPNPVYRYRKLPDSATDGSIMVKRLATDWLHVISLVKEGYVNAQIVVGGVGTDKVGVISPNIRGNTGEVVDSNNAFTVQMHPTSPPATRPASE